MHLLLVILEFAVVLGIMVLVHELGHFAVAKACGVHVETFSIGFGPRLFGWRAGDTDYRLSLLPLGGYVKMSGDIPGEIPTGDPGEFNGHPRWQRVLIVLAGPAANFLLSFFLLILVGHFHHEVERYLSGPAVVDYVPQNTPAAQAGIAAGDTFLNFDHDVHPSWRRVLDDTVLNLNRTVPISFEHNGQPVSTSLKIDTGSTDEFSLDSMLTLGLIPRMQAQPIIVASVESDTPAERAGLQNGDQIIQIDNFRPHSVAALLAYLQDRHGAPATVELIRKNQTQYVGLTPEQLPGNDGQPVYRIGFAAQPVPVDIERLPLGDSIVQSFKDNLDDSTLILRVLKGMFTRHVSVRSLSGPVGIAQQIDLAAQSGFWTLVRFMSTISLNLGIFNLLPIPILDGGMILFLAIESVMRRDLNQQIKERVYQVAFVCLIAFAVFIIFNDITKLRHP
jgi:regulator of sigma E protease